MSGFSVVVADPPWRFSDALPGKGRGASAHYPTLSIPEIMRFPLPPIANNAVLFLWRVASQVPEAYKVCEAWGFTPKTEIVWVKRTETGKRWFGMGRYTRAEHETCIVAVRGKPATKSRSIRSTFEAAVPGGRHSAKPEAFFDLVEQLVDGPYAELFARRKRMDWTCIGNEVQP